MIRSLSFHASYGCRHRGACCTSDWPIPVEADRLSRLRAALATGALPGRSPAEANFLWPDPPAADAPALLATEHGRCIFHDAEACRCRVQRVLGHEALPLACRQFPRVTLEDPRGTSITLSHYCPTAASMLDDHAEVEIVTAAPAFPAIGEYVGLDARTALPPLLRPDMLMDWESWWEWERLSVEALAGSAHSAEHARGRLAAAVEHTRTWRPQDGPLIARVRAAFRVETLTHSNSTPLRAELIRSVVEAIPAAHRPARLVPNEGAVVRDAALARFLAAHAFANWTALLGQGLRTWRRSLDAAHALASGFGVRHADLLLRHLADPAALAENWSEAERS